jgi:hypothetical protein
MSLPALSAEGGQVIATSYVTDLHIMEPFEVNSNFTKKTNHFIKSIFNIAANQISSKFLRKWQNIFRLIDLIHQLHTVGYGVIMKLECDTMESYEI